MFPLRPADSRVAFALIHTQHPCHGSQGICRPVLLQCTVVLVVMFILLCLLIVIFSMANWSAIPSLAYHSLDFC